MSTTTTESRRFGMHQNLLYDVITRQAGTLEKALLEGVMNGVDAGATRIDITLDENLVRIVDDGSGFADRQAIEQFFETFGTPHQEGDAVYGRYRMGRGQMMAFGLNRWRTNIFRMVVDIKNKGLDYDLEEGLKPHKGCEVEIDLYRPLVPSELDAIIRQISTWVAFVSVPVRINKKLVSVDPAEQKWDVETDEAWIKLAPSKSTLTVYNLGVRVNEVPASRYGMGGIVVSKKRLDVNFARTDIIDTCPVFRAIRAELKKHAGQETSKPRINDHQRQHLAERITGHDCTIEEALDFPVITDTEGRHFSIQTLTTRLGAAASTIVAAPRGDRKANKVAQLKLAVAIAQETLDRFGVRSLDEWQRKLAQWAAEIETRYDHRTRWRSNSAAFAVTNMKVAKVSDFDHLVQDTYEAVPATKLTKLQRAQVKAVQYAANCIAWSLRRRTVDGLERGNARKIAMGRSDIAEAWTDGMQHIWIEERQLALVTKGHAGAARIAGLLLHEYMHDAPDTDTHTHDLEFYERYHDTALDSDVIGDAVVAIMRSLVSTAKEENRKAGRTVLLFQDQESILARAGIAPDELPSVDDQPPADADEALVAEAA